MADKILTVTDANFDSDVLRSERPVLVDFWASWCKPCLAMAPDLEAVAAEFDGRLHVAKLNVEENESTPVRYHITSLPTLILFKAGQVAEQRIGKLSKDALVKLVASHAG